MTRTAIDLFSGSGGVTAGLKAAGWHVISAVDNDPVASQTYRTNHPEVVFIEDAIERASTARALAAAAAGSEIDLLVVCAPCQPFSSQNRKRGNDQREQLILKSVRLIRLVRPKLVFFENVPGLASPSYRPILATLRGRMRRLGYRITDPLVKDAADYGVPQRRRRCIMLAARREKALEAFLALDLMTPRRTVYDAIARLLPLESGEAHPNDPLHCARVHSEIALKRLIRIPRDGGSRRSLPPELELMCHVGSDAFPDVYGRMRWHDVAPTLTTGCTDVTKGRYAHPHQHRAITLREAARLQSFDDDYVFKGNRSEIARQIGNAVPPAMIAMLASGFEAALAAIQR
jgi:DNA (cytosine-5)-methyltransferase 1